MNRISYSEIEKGIPRAKSPGIFYFNPDIYINKGAFNMTKNQYFIGVFFSGFILLAASFSSAQETIAEAKNTESATERIEDK
jgi:hypothetical protein